MNQNEKKIIEEARSWIGTPFRHQGRVKGQGVDCVGLIVKTFQAVVGENKFHDVTDYPHAPDGRMLLHGLRTHFKEIPIQEAKPGDVVLLAFDGYATHVGILTDKGIIHAYVMSGKRVIEHNMSKDWQDRIRGAFRLPAETMNG